jgi:predicted nucleic acid-binding protein
MRLKINIHAEAVPMQSLLRVARDHDLAAYDASFIELALRLGLPLASKDELLLVAARRAGVPTA